MRIAEIINEDQLEEINLRKAIATAALAGAGLGAGVGMATSPGTINQPSVSSASPSPTFTAAQKFAKGLAAKAGGTAKSAVDTARKTRPISDIETSAQTVSDIFSPAKGSERIISLINHDGKKR